MTLPGPNPALFGAFSSSTHKHPIAELRNGKVIFKQKPHSFEKASETMQEIVKFREMLDLRVQNQDEPLAAIPEEHKPLIVKLSLESDKAIAPLAKHIRSILLPGPGEVEDARRLCLESILPLPVVEHAIRMLMTRMNYGLDCPLGQKLPAAFCVWRWEVQVAYKDWLPKSAKDSAGARLTERIQASAGLRATFDSLSQVERDAILDPKGITKPPVKDTNHSEPGIAGNNEDDSEDHTLKDASIDMINDEELSENLVLKGRMKKAIDPEKAAKLSSQIKDREERRAAKAEKEKKQKEAQDKSRFIMASFFGKAKPCIRDSPTKDSNADTSLDNEFQRTFKPFISKKGGELAPYNWFLEGKRRACDRMSGVTHDEAIVIDDDTPMQAITCRVLSEGIGVSTVPAALQEFIGNLYQCSLNPCCRTRNVSPLKTYNPRSVRDTMSQLSDAEIAGDPTKVRYLLSLLRDRQIFPPKVLIFHEDSRPGYYGTWTRDSRVVGPRTPLKRDALARDYGYDSGEEWEDEGPDEADDVIDDGDDDEPDAEDADSDLDSWLVADDEEIRPPLNLSDLSPPPLDPSIPPMKRKVENLEKRPDKKRKLVVPLVPYTKGPFWETHIGRCEHDPFNGYRVQLLNDTPYPIDPFAFVSAISEEKSNLQSNSSLVVPSFPSMVQPSRGATAPSASKRSMTSTPKTVFPEAHLDILLAKITDLATPNLPFLVESIYQDPRLRAHKVKKNAIEAKVREMGEKSRDKKIWVVRQAEQVHSLLPCGTAEALNGIS